jgi:thiamine biosynthesis protein ThiS
MITVSVNGQERSVPDGTFLGGLVRGLALDPLRIAVERNGAIVPRADYDGTELAEGDRLEIVQFVGGG